MSHDEITRLLKDAGGGGQNAAEQLYPLVYDELRRLAQSQLEHERPGHTLQATALVHEAYMKMVGQTRVEWKSRAQFFAIAAQAIRRILVDYARRRSRIKRGGEQQRVDLADIMNLPADAPSSTLIDLEEAMYELEREHPEKSRVVEMRFYAGLTMEEIAGVLNTSTRTVERHWQYARTWLFRKISEND